MGVKYIYVPLLVLALFISSIISLTAQSSDNSKFTLHTVLKSETSYGIAKKYQISLNDFFISNPNAAKGLKKGEIVKIPIKVVQKKEKKEIVIKVDTLLKKHIVLKLSLIHI